MMQWRSVVKKKEDTRSDFSYDKAQASLVISYDLRESAEVPWMDLREMVQVDRLPVRSCCRSLADDLILSKTVGKYPAGNCLLFYVFVREN